MLDSPYLTLIGRVLLGLMFLVSGIHKIADPHGTQQYMIMMGMTWMTTLFYIGAVAVEVAGSLSLLLGYRARAVGWLLFLFMIPHDAYLPHQFWRREPDDSLSEKRIDHGRIAVRRPLWRRPLQHGCGTGTDRGCWRTSAAVEKSRASIGRGRMLTCNR